jgi:hypothetical protein
MLSADHSARSGGTERIKAPLPTAQPGALADAGAAYGLLIALIFALQFGPLIGLLGFRWTGDQNWVLAGAARDAGVAMIVGLATVSWLSGRAHPVLLRSARWAIVMVLVYGVLALMSGSTLIVLALNLRRLALPPLLFLALLMIPWSSAQINNVFLWVVFTSVIVAVFGIVERSLPDTFWTDWLELESYTQANGFDRFGSLSFQESGRYYTYDLEPWLGAPSRRMLSSYLEPTTLAAAMALLLVLGLARRARGHTATGLLLLALGCGAATFSKGFVLFLLALFCWRLIGAPSPRHVLALSAAACAVAVLAAQLHLLEGPLQHIAGLDSGLRHLAAGNWLGEGIGEAGNYTNADTNVGEESGLGNAMGQTGLAAILPLLWVAAIVRDVYAAARARSDLGGPWLAAWLLFWTLTYLFSASSLAVGGNALGFALMALYLHPAMGARGATLAARS